LAFTTAVITVITLLALALLIAFNALFLAQPSTCILTPTCTSQSISQSSFAYNMSRNFFSTFNSLNGFRTYTLSQSKYLFQTVQISVGCLGFVLCIVYLMIYIMRRMDTSNQVIPMSRGRDSGSPESSIPDRGSSKGSESKRKLYPQRTSYVSQPASGEIPRNARRNY
jgi:hypothetical protein